MAPVATSSASGLLEHPAEAFADYRADGVPRWCARRSTWARAPWCSSAATRTAAPAPLRRADGGRRARVYTRTGRPFFADRSVDRALLDRVRAAVDRRRPVDELDTDWLLLDAELLPWSAKAEELLREQYAASARRRGPRCRRRSGRLDGGRRRAASTSDRPARPAPRTAPADAEAFTDGLPALLLAGRRARRRAAGAVPGAGRARGDVPRDRDHGWHLEIADRLVAADPGLLPHHPAAASSTRPTRRRSRRASSGGRS